jgi:hypothetical protein
MEAGLMDESRHDAVAVQGGAEIVGGDKKVLAPLLIRQHMARSTRVDLKLSGEEIGCLGQDVMIAPNPHDPSLALQESQRPVEKREIASIQPERSRNTGRLERFPLQQGKQICDKPLIQALRFP